MKFEKMAYKKKQQYVHHTNIRYKIINILAHHRSVVVIFATIIINGWQKNSKTPTYNE